MTDIINSSDYVALLNSIKQDIQTSRIKAHLAVNKELIMLYWRIGRQILNGQEERFCRICFNQITHFIKTQILGTMRPLVRQNSQM
jgi:predicted nuclease of restriction endonuclease-like (RecB) superfamily